MGEDPREIRAEIEDTRGRMSDTVDALTYKADVKTRAKESVSEKVGTLKSKVTGATGSVRDSIVGARDSVSESTPDTEQVKHQARRAAGIAQENPIGLALGSVAVGFVAGMLVPSTRVEDEKIGPVADQVKERAAETSQEALQRGKQVARDVAGHAKETARESGRQQAQEVKEQAKQSAQETRQQISS